MALVNEIRVKLEQKLADTRFVENGLRTSDDDEHERTFHLFVVIAAVGVMHAGSVLIGLAIGGVLAQWTIGAIIILLATVAAAYSLMTRTTRMSAMVVGLSLATLALVGFALA